MKKRYIYTLSSLLFLGAVGCNKPTDFGDTNTNPAQVNTKLLDGLLANSEIAAVGYASTNTEALNGAMYSQYISETQYSNTSLYALPQLSFTGNYSGTLFDLQSVIDDPKATKNQVAVSKILQQYIFWVITDAWGDVPYSEALKGVQAVTPKYDKQEDIYKGILATLSSAAASLDGSAIAGDLIFGGDATAWKRTANSLIMLVAIQESKKAPAAGAAAFKAAYDSNTFIASNSQNFKLAFPGGNYKSRWWSLYDGRKDYAESKTMTDLLSSFGDSRINSFGGASEVAGNTATSTIGVPYGLKRDNVTPFTDANPTWARVLKGNFRTETGTVNMITAGEVALAIAEANKLGWVVDATAYNKGITLSFEQWGVTLPASYLTSTNVALGTGTKSDDEKIATQRWIASYPDGHLGWNIYRKSGFPVLTPAPDAVGAFVNRFTYASSEQTSNEANVKEAIARIPGGKDVQEAKVWWAQ